MAELPQVTLDCLRDFVNIFKVINLYLQQKQSLLIINQQAIYNCFNLWNG